MPNDIQKLYDLPDISFVDGITYEGILEEMIQDYQTKYEEVTKRRTVLRTGDKEQNEPSEIFQGRLPETFRGF